MSYELALTHLGFSLQKINELLDKIKDFFISGCEKFNDYKTHLFQINQLVKKDIGAGYKESKKESKFKEDIIEKIDQSIENLDGMKDTSRDIVDESRKTKRELKLSKKDVNELLMQIEEADKKENFCKILEKIQDLHEELSNLIATAKKQLHSAINPEISAFKKMREEINKLKGFEAYMSSGELVEEDRESKTELERIERLFNRVLGKFRKLAKGERKEFKEIADFKQDIEYIGDKIRIAHIRKKPSRFSRVG